MDKPETSKNIGDLSEDENYSEDVFCEKCKQSSQNPTSTRKSEELCLPSDTSSNTYHPFTPISKSSLKDPGHEIELGESHSSTDMFISSRSLRSRTKCSRNLDALISPRKNSTVPSAPVLLPPDASGSNVSRRGRSSVGEQCDIQFVSPSDRVTRSHSKALAETNTPSPDKRSVEVQTPTPTKKMRRRPERSSGRFRSKQESGKTTLTTSTDAKTFRKSPTAVQTQEKKPSAAESQSLTPPALVSNRKRKTTISSSEESETAGDLYKPKVQSPTSDINTAHKSPSSIQTQESKLDVENVGESCIKISKPLDYTLVSSNDTEMAPSELGLSPSSHIILNPHVSSSPSKIVDSGIETRKFESSKILNPQLHTSCHSPIQGNSIINTSPRKLKYETSDENGSFSSTLKSPSRTTTFTSTYEGIKVLRRSMSDETSIPRYGKCGQSNAVITPVSLKKSRSLSESAKDLNPQFRRIVTSKNTIDFCMKSISDDVSTSENRQTGKNDINTPNINVSTSEDELLIGDYLTESSTSENPPAWINNYPSCVYNDMIEMESSTSSCQPLTTDDYITSSDDYLDSSSDVSQPREVRGRSRKAVEQFAPSGNEFFEAYDSEALLLLRNVIKQMLLYSKEVDQLKTIESLFVRFSQSPSKEHVRNLYTCLMTYSDSRKNDSWIKNLLLPKDMTIETYLEETFEKLLTIVIGTCASSLCVRSCSDFDGIILNYQNFKTFNDIFSSYFENNNIDDIEDETSRNHLRNLKEKIQRFSLVVQTAYQYFLIYIGQHAEEKSLAIYEDKLSEMDKRFLRRQH